MPRQRKLMVTPQALRNRLKRDAMTEEELDLERLKMKCRIYGLSVFRYREMYAMQGHKCAICLDAIPEVGRGVHIDHDHDTGRVRGLLCAPCNQALPHKDRLEAYATSVERYLNKEA